MPLIGIVGLVWGASRFFGSRYAKDALIAVTVTGGLILAVVEFARMFPNVLRALVGLLAPGFYALMFIGVILGIAVRPPNEETR